MVEGIEIRESHLKISKEFNEKYKAQTDKIACGSNIGSAIFYDKVIDDQLKKMGLAREVTNKI